MIFYVKKPLTKTELRQLRKEIIESYFDMNGLAAYVDVGKWIKVEPTDIPKFRLHGKAGIKKKRRPPLTCRVLSTEY